MSLEENKALIRRLFEAFNKHNVALLDELIAPDYVDHPRQFKGLESYKQYLTMLYNSFPDTHEVIESIIAEGDKVCIHLKGTATHTGEYRGLAPTGRKTKWESIVIWRIVNGKIVEMLTAVSDELDFLKQLRIIEWKGFPDETK